MDTTLRIHRDYSGAQILGRRKEQQDCYAFSVLEGTQESAEWLLAVVADGLGGYAGGRQAAMACVQGFLEGFLRTWAAEHPARAKGAQRTSLVGSCLQAGVLQANQAIRRETLKLSNLLEGSGSTLVALLLGGGAAYWISVGDSPLFLWRDGELHRLNADHSMRAILEEKVAAGEMFEEELERHPARNMLISALMGEHIEMIDGPTGPFDLKHGDLFICASDGLLTLPPAALRVLLAGANYDSMDELVGSLLEGVYAARDPHQDNATILLVRWGGGSGR